ncbi:MAG: hypothetical protein GY696_21030, partial [Gammaproteobacteria bacterium]|nr:hypothetical protein [Gammaproteobacteria bacterium]
MTSAPLNQYRILSLPTQERQIFGVIVNMDSVCVSTERHFARDSIVVHSPSEMTRSNHDFLGQFVIPLSQRQRVFQLCHEDIFNSHLGVEEILAQVPERFFRSNLKQTVYVRHSQDCQAKMSPPQVEQDPMTPISVFVPFDTVRVDGFSPLHITVSRNFCIAVHTCYLTEWVEHFYGLTSDFSPVYLTPPLSL